MKRKLLVGLVLSLLVLVAVGGVGLSGVSAYESYHDPGQDGAGYCATCHPGFVGGSSSPLHALHFGTSTSNCNLCHGAGPPLTMWSTDDPEDPDELGCAGCHGRDYGETIGADHGGFAITGLSKASAYGLRDHHDGAGVTQCVACHGTTTVQPEDVPPPYYSRTDVTVKDPCADNLDNDGDGQTDGNDLDCPDVYLPAVMRQYP